MTKIVEYIEVLRATQHASNSCMKAVLKNTNKARRNARKAEKALKKITKAFNESEK